MQASTGTSYERLIGLEGCFNFRDLGGYPTADGRTVRWRRLFRADGLTRLTEADIDILAGFGLTSVVDLRTLGELEKRGRLPWTRPGLSYHHLPMTDVLPDREQFPQWVDSAYVVDRYAEMLQSGRATTTATLRVLCDPLSFPAVIHCAAGKDRTGIVSAVVLGLLGVPDEVIVADYALSGAAMRRMLDWLMVENPDAIDRLDHNAAAILAAPPETMALFLQRFRADHGSFDQFAASLGLEDAHGRLRAALLE